MSHSSRTAGSVSLAAKAAAWSVHLFTASGAVWGYLAILAIQRHAWQQTFVWMGAAVAVDGMDGWLARRCRVKEVLPGFDGSLLDNIVDYITYALVPAFIFYQAGLLPPVFAQVAAIAVLLASAYQFCQMDAKTEQHFFTGFPSYWNVVAFYLLIWRLDPWINLALIALFCVLVFIPVRYVYPSRTKAYQRITLAVVFTWGATVLLLFFEYPTPKPWVMWLSILCMGYYVAVSLFLMIKSKPRHGSTAPSN